MSSCKIIKSLPYTLQASFATYKDGEFIRQLNSILIPSKKMFQN